MAESLDAAREQKLAALKEKYPRWRVWHDRGGWHAMRRGSFSQQYEGDSPSYSVHAPEVHLFAVLLAVEDEQEIPAGQWQP